MWGIPGHLVFSEYPESEVLRRIYIFGGVTNQGSQVSFRQREHNGLWKKEYSATTKFG
jgi:hypothetical protein